MTDVLFIQGAGEGVHDDWDLRLVESLRRELGPGYDVRYPRMPDEADPQLRAWGAVLKSELATLRPGGVLVGHSAGGTVAIDVLAGASVLPSLAAIVTIAAPFIGKGGWEFEELAPRADLAERLPRAVPIVMFHGEADDVVPVEHVDRYGERLPQARIRRLAGRDHQLNDDLSEVAGVIRELAPASGPAYPGTRRDSCPP